MYREETTIVHNLDNISTLNFTLLCIFPIALFLILFFKCKISKKNEFTEDFWGIKDARALQVFAAMGVLLHHLTGASTKYGEVYKGPVTIMSYVGILFTSIFFFFSGFGLIRSYQLKENYLDGFIKKKFNAVLVPFMVSNLVYVLIGLAEGRIYDPLSFFTSVFGITLINTNAWFIVEIIILYLAFYFAFKYIKDDKKKMAAVILVAGLITITGFLLKHDYTRINGHWFRGEWWFNTTMIFAMGLIFGKNRDKIAEFFEKNYSKLFAGTIVLLAITAILESLARNNLSYYAETYTDISFERKQKYKKEMTITTLIHLRMVTNH